MAICLDISVIWGGYGNTIKFVKGKTLRVLVPYLIVGLFLCILQDRDMGQMLDGISHLWFLLVIFECYMLGKAIECVLHLPESKWKVLITLLILFFILIPYRLPDMQFLCLSRLISYFPYYLIGMLASKFDFKRIVKYRNKLLMLITSLILLFVLQQIFVKRGLITAAIGISFVILIFTYVRLLNIPKLPLLIKSLDKCSMGIYIVHHILIQELITTSLFRDLASEYYYSFPCVFFFFIILISWGIIWGAKKNKYSKYIIG